MFAALANQFSFQCKVCAASPDTVAFVEKEILNLRHGYRRVALKTGFSKSSLHRHISRCTIRRVAILEKEMRAPVFFDWIVIWPDGTRHEFQGAVDPFARHRAKAVERPMIEIMVEFEPPKPPRTPEQFDETSVNEQSPVGN